MGFENNCLLTVSGVSVHSGGQQYGGAGGQAVRDRQKELAVLDLAEGRAASAMAYSVITTAQENGIDVREYLTRLFSTGELALPLKNE